MEHLENEIKADGSGSSFHAILNSHHKVEVNHLIDWILIEQRGQRLKEFLIANFGNVIEIEHFHSFFRYRINSNESLGNVFGLLEENKSKMSII